MGDPLVICIQNGIQKLCNSRRRRDVACAILYETDGRGSTYGKTVVEIEIVEDKD